MTLRTVHIPDDQVQVLEEGTALSLSDLAYCGRVSTEWVITRVEAGVLQPARGQAAAEWRFASATLTRVRRIRQLELTYDADPQLAALAADLIEEVQQLRRRLRQL